jgi:hypothetical protein
MELVEVTGPILRLRAFGDEDDDEETRYYAAVDDGSSRRIRAFRLDRHDYSRLRQGELVTAVATPNLGCLRSIVSEEPEVPPTDDHSESEASAPWALYQPPL